jgi:hypothetical protein
MTWDERIRKELELVERRHGPLEVDEDLRWLVVKEFPLPRGWNREATWVVILAPPGYPTTPPDNFYTDPELRLANGASPSNTSGIQEHAGRRCLMFSYHVESGDWKPHADIESGHNLLTYLEGVAKRLSEAD